MLYNSTAPKYHRTTTTTMSPGLSWWWMPQIVASKLHIMKFPSHNQRVLWTLHVCKTPWHILTQIYVLTSMWFFLKSTWLQPDELTNQKLQCFTNNAAYEVFVLVTLYGWWRCKICSEPASLRGPAGWTVRISLVGGSYQNYVIEGDWLFHTNRLRMIKEFERLLGRMQWYGLLWGDRV